MGLVDVATQGGYSTALCAKQCLHSGHRDGFRQISRFYMGKARRANENSSARKSAKRAEMTSRLTSAIAVGGVKFAILRRTEASRKLFKIKRQTLKWLRDIALHVHTEKRHSKDTLVSYRSRVTFYVTRNAVSLCESIYVVSE